MPRDLRGAVILVAPDGCLVGERSPDCLVTFLGDPCPDYDAALFAVRNLGFIRLRHHSVLLEVTVHPKAVASPTVDAAIVMIATSDAEVFRIEHLQQDWRYEIAASARAASTKLLELCRDAVAREHPMPH